MLQTITTQAKKQPLMKNQAVKRQAKKMLIGATLATLVAGSPVALAKVSESEAARLGQDLTPFGAEQQGNVDGSIPAWMGGLSQPPASWKAPNGHRPDPYADDKALFSITADNFEQYADKLSEGQKALFRAYPDTFKMDIYPTRRSHAAPDWVVANTRANAGRAVLTDNGNSIQGAYGGIPFPIPQNGLEAIWNHLVRFQGTYKKGKGIEALVQPNGTSSRWTLDQAVTFPYYDPKGDLNSFSGEILKYSSTTTEPARDSGEGILAIDYVNPGQQPRKAWVYDPGERRVRRAPTLAFDTPDRVVTVYDDYELFGGSPERYDWKLVGKQELYIPYNNYELMQPKHSFDDILQPKHPNPGLVRYELHRVWVVEANLKEGMRHLYPRRTFFIDEDSWNISVTDKFDGKGDLWRMGMNYLVNYYDVPATNYTAYVHHDLKTDVYYVWGLKNEFDEAYDFSLEPPKNSFYTPQALRRRGR